MQDRLSLDEARDHVRTHGNRTDIRRREARRLAWRVFDEKLILKVDPLRKGERVRATIRPWNDTFVVDALERVGASAPAGSAGIGEDEIPF